MITGSAVERLLNCPGSAAIPQARTLNVYQEQGTANHAALEDGIHAGDYSALPESIQAELANYEVVQAEVAVAYDVATGQGRELGIGIGRQYADLAPYEIAGTADLVAIDAARTKLLLVDHKLFLDAGWPAKNPQLLFYALALSRRWGISDVKLAIQYTGTGRVSWATLDALDIDAFAARLTDLHLRVAAEQAKVARGVLPDVIEGPYCKHCPARHVCPAKVALARRVLSGDELNVMAVMRPLDDDAAARLYHDIKRARTVLDELSKAVYAKAAEAPFSIGNGKMLGRYTKPGNERLDGDIVYAAVKAHLGQAVADKAVVMSATKSRLHEAVGSGKVEKEILEAVRAAGGASKAPKEEVGEYVPRLAAGDEEAA